MISKKPQVVANYGDPRKSKRWPAKKIRREFAKEILEIDNISKTDWFDDNDWEKMQDLIND